MKKFISIIIMSFFSFAHLSLDAISSPFSLIENNLRHPVQISGTLINRMSLKERMAHYNVPGLSLAIVDQGKIVGAQGYGHISFDPESQAVNAHTLFQSGSVSKSLTAFGALLLVQQGKISLDEDVNLYLKSWKIPESTFTELEKVTLRRLLSHTAGTSVSGFPGYPINSPLPALIDILDGTKPLVNTDPVRVIATPGTQFQYSGGGTTIVQLLIEDITGEQFSEWMQKNVLNPLGMLDSSFSQPLSLAHCAFGHIADGKRVEGNWHVYPEMGAAGLWSNPNDLAKFILYIQSGLKSGDGGLLQSEYIQDMIRSQIEVNSTKDSGLGLFMENKAPDPTFQHKGQNEGFITSLYAFSNRDQGFVIMIPNASAWGLMDEITNSIADIYGWPNFKPKERKRAPAKAEQFDRLIGSYYHEKEKLDVIRQGGRLFVDFKNQLGCLIELHPENETTYFMQEADMELQFFPAKGQLLLIDSSTEIYSNTQPVLYSKKS